MATKPHFTSHDYGLKVTEGSFRIGNIVETICAQPEMGQYQNEGHEVDVTDPKSENGHMSSIFPPSLELIQRPSTSKNSKIHNHSQDARFRSLSDFIMKMFVVENKIFLEKTCRYYITVNLI